MKALVYNGNGQLNGLQKTDMPKPTPKDNEILIKVIASSVNNTDLSHFKSAIEADENDQGSSLLNKATPKSLRNNILGTDVSGIVVEVGDKVTKFEPGDKVFGISGYFNDSWAEYASLSESHAASKPYNLSFAESAALPTTGGTALAASRKAAIKPKQNVLIQGATGGVGLFALQMAKAAGATVTAVCSTKNTDLVAQYGADNIIDYKKEDVTQTSLNNQYDVIIVINGYHSLGDYRRILKDDGRLVIVGGKFSQTLTTMLFGPVLTLGQKKQFGATSLITLKDDWLGELAFMARNNQLRPYLDDIYSWDDVHQAITTAIKEHTSGKIALQINEEEK